MTGTIIRKKLKAHSVGILQFKFQKDWNLYVSVMQALHKRALNCHRTNLKRRSTSVFHLSWSKRNISRCHHVMYFV